MCPEKINVFFTISLSANTVARRVENLGRNLVLQLKDKATKFECCSFALDESTDVSDTSQLLLFVKGIDVNFEILRNLCLCTACME